MRAFSGASISPLGSGIYSTIASRRSSIPIPVFPDTSTALSEGNPITSSISSFTLSGSAEGKSILFITGNISRSFSRARYTFANVCASIP